MILQRGSAIVFTIFSAIVFFFQVALVCGAPWGSFAMGGAYPGQFPSELRIAAAVQAMLWIFIVAIVLARAQIAFQRFTRVSHWLVWVIVSLNAIGLILNIITPSAVERMIWAPIGFILLITNIIVAVGPKGSISQGSSPAA